MFRFDGFSPGRRMCQLPEGNQEESFNHEHPPHSKEDTLEDTRLRQRSHQEELDIVLIARNSN